MPKKLKKEEVQSMYDDCVSLTESGTGYIYKGDKSAHYSMEDRPKLRKKKIMQSQVLKKQEYKSIKGQDFN